MAVRVRFLADVDFSPGAYRGRVTVAYRAGWSGLVNDACAAAALAAGKAECIDVQAPETESEHTHVETPRRRSRRARRV
jgi:hypothetical protein